MCNHCYHKYGRNSCASECVHTDRLVYAKGKCQNCYLNDYNKKKRRIKKEKFVDEHIFNLPDTLSNLVSELEENIIQGQAKTL